MATGNYSQQRFLNDPLDVLLADIAIRVQLNPTDFGKAVNRYQTINRWIERDESPLKDRVELLYPQGSMAIGSTIASKSKADEFDIDIVAQLDLPPNVSPKAALGLLFVSIRGRPGSRYFRMAERKSRCVTVNYSDDMHLDVTPAVRMRGTLERQSNIFHHKIDSQVEHSVRLVANPYGFSEWFKQIVPDDQAFAELFAKRSRDYEELVRFPAGRSDSDPVPAQETTFEKSKAVIALQLLKRWRNIQYDSRSVRKPPSIILSKLIADSANQTDRLSKELLNQSNCMLKFFKQRHRLKRLVHIANPVCAQDILTDRWPESLNDQAIFIADLENFIRQIERIMAGCDLAEMKNVMIGLFGEAPTTEAFRALNDQIGSTVRTGKSGHLTGTGGMVLSSTPFLLPKQSVARPTPKHTFYGRCEEL